MQSQRLEDHSSLRPPERLGLRFISANMDSVTQLPTSIRNQVQQTNEAQGQLLNKLDDLISGKLGTFNQQMNENQRMLSDVQVAKIEQINNEKHKFNKKCNEEQKLREADALLKEEPRVRQMTSKAQEKIEEGMKLIEYRQKLIKMADSSELGWRTVNEYQANVIADDSDDKNKIWKAESRAQRKAKQQSKRFSRLKRLHPYTQQGQSHNSQYILYTTSPSNANKPGVCFSCGKPGHWRADCRRLQRVGETEDKISEIRKLHCLNSAIPCASNGHEKNKKITSNLHISTENVDAISSLTASGDEGMTPRGRLKDSLSKWVTINSNQVVLDIIKDGYKLPLHSIPNKALLSNNRSARGKRIFVEKELRSLLHKGCISQVEVRPYIVNPLTVV